MLGLINGTESYFVYNEERWGYKIWKPGPKIHPQGDLSERERGRATIGLIVDLP